MTALGLAWRTARLIERTCGAPVPDPRAGPFTIVHDAFGGAYGRASPSGIAAAASK